jgi:hypothetical protein
VTEGIKTKTSALVPSWKVSLCQADYKTQMI